MKFPIAVVVLCVLTRSLSQHIDYEDLSDVYEAEVEDDQLWQVPQIDGSLEWMTEQEAKDRTLSTEFGGNRNRWIKHLRNKRRKIRFFLYTQKNPSKWQEIDIERLETLQRSNFNSSHPTR